MTEHERTVAAFAAVYAARLRAAVTDAALADATKEALDARHE